MIRWLALAACILTIVITAASAFLRHTQAGLGCAPWPACYRDAGGQGSGQERAAAVARPPAGDPDTVFVVRALHRVSAMLVGLLALGIALFGWTRLGAGDRLAAAFALADTVFLSWLGRYTPHDLPLVTLGNVLGGFALAAAFGWIAAGRRGAGGMAGGMAGTAASGAATVKVAGGARGGSVSGSMAAAAGRARMLVWGGLALVALQSAAGLMISVRQAVDACAGLSCAPSGAPVPGLFDPSVAMVVASAAEGRPLHLLHRLLALLVLAVALTVFWRLRAGRAGGRGAAVVGAAGVADAAGRRAAALAIWPLPVVAGLAAAGVATASGGGGALTGTLHNVLGAVLFVLFTALARCQRRHGEVDSR